MHVVSLLVSLLILQGCGGDRTKVRRVRGVILLMIQPSFKLTEQARADVKYCASLSDPDFHQVAVEVLSELLEEYTFFARLHPDDSKKQYSWFMALNVSQKRSQIEADSVLLRVRLLRTFNSI